MIIKVTKRLNQLFDKIIYISGEKIYMTIPQRI